MLEQERQILQELFAVSAIAVVIACPVFAMIRRQYPDLSWNTHGNVWTSPFGVVEAVLAGLIFVLASALVASTPAEVPAPTVASVVAGSLIFAAIAGIVVGFLGWIRGLNLVELFGLSRLKGWSLIGISFAWFIPAALAGFAVKFAFDQFVWQAAGMNLEDQEIVVALREGGMALKFSIFLTAVVMAPIAEEILFRGLMYASVKRYTERYFAAVFSALAFGLIHANLGSFVPLVVLGMFFALAYEITGCLAVPILMHAFFNGISVLMILNDR
ncbi:MAG: type II CAAX endopeptidase family protein [Verrucomicrobia bacterium]|nr:type II CAAX endopeptidase family protein [Verrucomicrobiota bacterium]